MFCQGVVISNGGFRNNARKGIFLFRCGHGKVAAAIATRAIRRVPTKDSNGKANLLDVGEAGSRRN